MEPLSLNELAKKNISIKAGMYSTNLKQENEHYKEKWSPSKAAYFSTLLNLLFSIQMGAFPKLMPMQMKDANRIFMKWKYML